jgi:hypothetical protein
VHKVLKIPDAARKAVDAGDHEDVAGVQKGEQGVELAAAIAPVPDAFSARITLQPAAFRARF